MQTIRTMVLGLAGAAAMCGVAAPVSAAELPGSAATILAAEGWNHDGRYRQWDHDGYGRGYGDYRRSSYYQDRSWRGRDGRTYCRRSDGTTGLLVGGAAGALLGREVAGRRGDRTLGAILGAAGGALLGREVDRGGSRCR